MSDLWEHKVWDSPPLPTLPFPFPLPLPVSSPSCSISFSSSFFPCFGEYEPGSYCLSLPRAVPGSAGHPAQQEIPFKQDLEAVLGCGWDKSAETVWIECAQVWREEWWVVCLVFFELEEIQSRERTVHEEKLF